MASGCKGRDSVELLEIQHTPPHAPGPPGPCALQLHYAARPHPASPNFCHHLHTPSSQAPVTLVRVTAAAGWFIPLAKMQEQKMEEEDNPLDQHGVMSVGWPGWLWMTQMKWRHFLASGEGGRGDAKGKESRVDAKGLFL